MLDISFIRSNPDTVKEGIQKKHVDPKLVDKFLRVDADWRVKIAALDQLQAEQNALAREVATKKTEHAISKAQLVKKRVTELTKESVELERKREDLLSQFPNIPFSDVPIGVDEKENKILREVGIKPKFSFEPKDHIALGESLNVIDIKKAAEVSGARFGYLLGGAALLEFGLIKLALDLLVKEKFIPVVPPVMIRPDVFAGMGRLAGDQKEERYHLQKDDLYLIGSAEHTLGPLHMNEVLDLDSLPLRYVGFSTSFRREAGTYGKDMKGIFRVHQFDKVEMFSFATPEQSQKEHEKLLSLQEELMKALEIPYRVVEICTGDMGWTDARQYDIESWMPSQNQYRETHSCSNTTDYQARGINVKYKTGDGKKEVVHLLNGTAFAIGRTIITIMENYQTKKGTIKIPAVLQKHIGLKEIKV